MSEPRITQETLHGAPVVCVHLLGMVLVMSPERYEDARVGGKLWRRQQANAARARRDAARAEANQLCWIVQYGDQHAWREGPS